MIEKLQEQVRPRPEKKLGVQAVSFCDICPNTTGCLIKALAPCETVQEMQTQTDSGGGSYGEAFDKPIRSSYLDDLFDPTKPTVMAEMQKKKEKQQIQAKAIDRVAKRTPVHAKKAEAVKSEKSVPAPVKLKDIPERQPEKGSDLIAGIFLSMIGVKGLATVRGKNSV